MPTTPLLNPRGRSPEQLFPPPVALAQLREPLGLSDGDYLDILLPPCLLRGVRVKANLAATFELDLRAAADPGPAGPSPDLEGGPSLCGGPFAVTAADYYADDALAGWTVVIPDYTWVRVLVATAAPLLNQLTLALLLRRI